MMNLHKVVRCIALVAAAIFPFSTKSQSERLKTVSDTNWIARSNNYTKILLDIDKKYSPEFGSSQGLAQYDTLVSVPTLANIMAEHKEKQLAVSLLNKAKKRESKEAVQQDLDILINSLQLDFRKQDFELRRKVSFLNATSRVFQGLQILLDDQTPAERRPAAIIRLSKYAGSINGYQPLTVIFKSRVQKQLQASNMIYPSKQQMEVELSRNASMVSGIEELFKKYRQTGWEQSYAIIKKQLDGIYNIIYININI